MGLGSRLIPEGFSFALSRNAVVGALVLVAAALVVLQSMEYLIGPNTAQAGYLAILFLLSPSRTFRLRMRLLAAAWAIAVALLGFLAGSLGLWVTLAGLVLVCLVQGLFRIGEIASLSRSPVNFVVFAGIGGVGEVQLWQVLLGSVLGAGVMVLVAWMYPVKTGRLEQPTGVEQRVRYGLMLAAGSVLIVVVGELLGAQFVEWALVSFCVILAVGFDDQLSRSRDRLLGTIVGCVAATLVTLLPDPVPVIAGLLCALLAIAYINMGSYALFVTFFTPAILLTTASELPGYAVATGRIGAVLVAVALALACTALFRPHGRGARDASPLR